MSNATRILNKLSVFNYGDESEINNITCMRVSEGLWNTLKDEDNVTVFDSNMLKYENNFGIFYLYRL